MNKFLVKFSEGIGKVVDTFIGSAREAVDLVMKTILPFMVFISAIVAIITGTGVGKLITNQLGTLANNPLGLFIIAIITSLPFVAPLLSPGAVVPAVIGTMIGTLIATGQVPVTLALPAVFAIHQVSGADFIPVGLAMADAEDETIEIAVPAVLYSKILVAPVEMGLALLVSMLIYR